MRELDSNGTGQTPLPSTQRTPTLAVAEARTCFLRLGDGVTGARLLHRSVRAGRSRLAQSPGLGDPPRTSRLFCGVWGLYSMCSPHNFASGPLCWIFDPLVPLSWVGLGLVLTWVVKSSRQYLHHKFLPRLPKNLLD